MPVFEIVLVVLLLAPYEAYEEELRATRRRLRNEEVW